MTDEKRPHHTRLQRLARAIQKERGIKYTEALRIAKEQTSKEDEEESN